MSITDILRSVVAVNANIPEDAYTAETLGTRREGSGVVIRENGLVLTIGYLITEADDIWLSRDDGLVVPGYVVAYDQPSGFGLVQALGDLQAPPLQLGDSDLTDVGDRVFLIDGMAQSVPASVVAKQEFAGYWEYLLDEAIFTSPAHPSWGGAALVNEDNKVVGIGSLRLQMSQGGTITDINMSVPINLLKPILDDLMAMGQVDRPPRPWLGAYSAENNGRVVVMSVSTNSPAEEAGLREGDIITDIRDGEVEGLADLYRKVWDSGDAGVEIPMRIIRDGRDAWLRIKSADRGNFLKKPQIQ